MSDQPEIKVCPNCGSSAISEYCSSCGQKIYRKRFTVRQIFEVISNALNIEKGFLHTMIWMFKNPGRVVNDYLKGKTKTYFNPFNYILIIAGIYAFLILSLHIIDSSYETTNQVLMGDSVQSSPETLAFQQQWFDFVKRYTNLIPLLMVPFASLFSKWYYKKQKLYYGEHLIINLFIFAQNILISVLLSPFVVLFPPLLKAFPLLNLGFTVIYFTYALKRIFRQSVFRAFIGSFAIYVGGFLFFMTLIIILIVIVMIVLQLLGMSLTDLAK